MLLNSIMFKHHPSSFTCSRYKAIRPNEITCAGIRRIRLGSISNCEKKKNTVWQFMKTFIDYNWLSIKSLWYKPQKPGIFCLPWWHFQNFSFYPYKANNDRYVKFYENLNHWIEVSGNSCQYSMYTVHSISVRLKWVMLSTFDDCRKTKVFVCFRYLENRLIVA